MMGFKSELRQFPKYQKLNELNKEVDSTENRKVGFYYEATRVLTALELPIKLRDSVLKNADGFYSILGKGTYHRLCRGGRRYSRPPGTCSGSG